MKKYIVFLLLVFALSGCSSLGRGLMKGYIDAQEQKKNDVRCHIMSEGFEGLQRAKEKTIKVLMVHGIGSHVAGHSVSFMTRIAERMGMDTLNRTYKEIQMLNQDNEKVGILRAYHFANTKTEQNIIFYEQTWSQITDEIKKELAFDTAQAYAQNRAPLNARMKSYLNATFPDTAIYFGKQGQLMLDSSLQAFCWMAGYTYDELPNNVNSYCQVTPSQLIRELSTENFAFITNSLGSRLTIDTLQTIVDRMRTTPKTQNSQKAAKLLQEKEITIFMLANQLPLLQMGRNPPEHTGQFEDYCFKNGKKYNQRLFKKVNVVAFSDPNDLLSYGLAPDSADKYLDNSLCPEISNVSITNTPALDIGLGEVANPLAAHTGYQKNPYILDLIVHGLEDEFIAPSIQDKCRWIKLKEDK